LPIAPYDLPIAPYSPFCARTSSITAAIHSLGYGLFVLEEVKWSNEGRLCTNGPGTYQIPRFSDIPSEFNVSLLKGMSNPHAIHSSKGIGEPALFLASSVFFAIKNAIMAARHEVGLDDPFRLDSPATPEKIRMACVDQFSSTDKGHTVMTSVVMMTSQQRSCYTRPPLLLTSSKQIH
ncbi:hypothetical protein LSAT2_013322, partial [Lamellibrachia satsuma]